MILHKIFHIFISSYLRYWLRNTHRYPAGERILQCTDRLLSVLPICVHHGQTAVGQLRQSLEYSILYHSAARYGWRQAVS